MPCSEHNLIWIDLEMTGLDVQNDVIIEIATVVTNADLEILDQGPVLAVHQSEDILIAMDKWNTKQHQQSGLIKRVLQSPYTYADAEAQTLDFLQKLVPANTSPMCGNSICQDRRFLYRLMPKLESYFTYRHLDVSTLKELKKRWAPHLSDYAKLNHHRALDDILDSIEELRYYRRELFKC